MKKFGWIILATFTIAILLVAPQLKGVGLAIGNLANPGFELAGATSFKATGWQDFGLGYQRIRSGRTGRYSLRLANSSTSQIAGAYQRVDLNQTELKPVFIGGWVRGLGVTSQPGSFLGASLYAEIHLKDGSVAYWNSIANTGTFDWRKIGFNTGTVSLVNQPISYIDVIPILGYSSGTVYFDDLVVQEYTPSQTAITIMFDDGEETTYSVGYPELKHRGLVGSAAIVTDVIDEPGYMTVDQLQTLQDSGWEIVSHSLSHTDLTTMSRVMMEYELYQSKKNLQSNQLTVRNFALPYGAYTGGILATAAKYYQSARAFEQGDNPQGLFPFNVKVRGVVNTTTLAELTGWTSQAKHHKRWLVLVFHSLTDQGDDQYHTSPATFKQMLDLVADSHIPVITYNQGLELYKAR